MLNLPVQVSVQTEYLEEKVQRDKRQGCLNLNSRKKDRHKLDRKTRYWRDFLKSENYHLISLENLIQKNLLNGGRETYIALAINNKKFFFFKENGGQFGGHLERQKDYLFAYLFRREQKEMEEVLKSRPRRFRKK